MELGGTVSCCRRASVPGRCLRDREVWLWTRGQGRYKTFGIPGGVNGVRIEVCTSYVALQAVSL